MQFSCALLVQTYAGDAHFPKHSLEYSLNFWSQSKKKKLPCALMLPLYGAEQVYSNNWRNSSGCGSCHRPYQGILECRLVVAVRTSPLSLSLRRKVLWESMNAGITTRQTVEGISGIVTMALGFATYECRRLLRRIYSTR